MTRIPIKLALLLGLLAFVACADEPLLEPTPSQAASALSDTPYYYYQGDKVFLDLDLTALIIATPLGDPTTAVEQALVGLAAPQLTKLTQLPDHWLATLAPGTNAAAVDTAIARLRGRSDITFAAPAYRYAVDGSPVQLLGRLAVRFRQGVAQASIDSVLSSLQLTLVRAPKPDSGWFYHVVTYPKERDPLEIAAILDRDPLVLWADPDKITGARLNSEPYFSDQYYLLNEVVLNGVPVDNNVTPAWNVTLGLWDVHVVVFDDGLEIFQQDNYCGQPFVWAYDAFLNQFPDHPIHPHANDWHGTRVAGIINGCHNAYGMAGMAPGVSIGIARIFRDGQYVGHQATADAINAAWATTWEGMGADVLSNSWSGGAPSNAVNDAITNAATLGRGGKGTVVVFSTGNASNREAFPNPIIAPVPWPATLGNVIAVGAIDRNGQLANYTPEGAALDLVAPSSAYVGANCGAGDLLTTDRAGAIGCNDGPSQDVNFTSTFGGTSAAAPQVAAAAALLLTVNPSLTRQDVTSLLLNNADRAGSWSNPNQFGQGKLNVWRAMQPIAPPPPPSVSISGPSVITEKGTYTWTANPSGGSGAYTYQWSVYYQATGQTYQLGTARSQEVTVYAGDGAFEMRVTLISGTESASASQTVQECINNPNCELP
jgi:subtilase family protein